MERAQKKKQTPGPSALAGKTQHHNEGPISFFTISPLTSLSPTSQDAYSTAVSVVPGVILELRNLH